MCEYIILEKCPFPSFLRCKSFVKYCWSWLLSSTSMIQGNVGLPVSSPGGCCQITIYHYTNLTFVCLSVRAGGHGKPFDTS